MTKNINNYPNPAIGVTQTVGEEVYKASFGVDGGEKIQLYDSNDKNLTFTLQDFYEN